jgi:hypothetical protein
MKISIIALATLLSTSAFALQVGDSANYTLTANDQSVETSMTVTEISGDQFTTQVTSSLGGQTQSGEGTGSLKEIEQMSAVFQNCLSVGGSFETVNVGSKGISSCHLKQDNQDLYLSPEVTFGVVKSVLLQNGTQISVTLNSFHKQ